MGVFQQPAGKDVLFFYTDRLKITVIARSTGDEAIPSKCFADARNDIFASQAL